MAEGNKTKGSAAKINYFIALLGIMAPAGYLIGLSYYQGTLSAYGLNPDSFPISSQDAYVTAYFAIGHFLMAITTLVVALFKAVFTPPGFYWLITVSLLVVIFFYVLIKKPALPRNRVFVALVLHTKRILRYLYPVNTRFSVFH